MENLNAEQVKKALECCAVNSNCNGCPFWEGYVTHKNCLQTVCKNALALITSQEQRIKEFEAECKQWRSDWEKNQKRWEIAYDELDKEKHDLELTLVGVMFSVDKWLDGAELELDEVNRAITMREKTLQIVEKLTEENERLRNKVTATIILTDKDAERIKTECLEKIELDVKAIQADTVRKMQERLKAKAYTNNYCQEIVLVADIDQIVKEVLKQK